MTRPRLLVVSHVLPFHGSSGQSQRVAYTLRAARQRFHVSFLTYAPRAERSVVQDRLAEYCDEAIVLPSLVEESRTGRLIHRTLAGAYAAMTGLKSSNYLVGKLELSPRRLAAYARKDRYDLVLFEYWHTWQLAKVFRDQGIPTVLDTHNVLWRAYERQLLAKPGAVWDRNHQWRLRKYRDAEERAWRQYDGLIAINREEFEELQAVATEQRVFYAPMGIDLARWPYCWAPRSPRRIAYYGGLGSPHNQRAALSCLQQVMPAVWARFPDAEFWIVGSSPPASLKSLESDPRVHVTGFVEDACELLGTMSVVLCPWTGRYGFRSRVVEILAAGPPLVVSRDGVAGMDLTESDGLGIVDNLEAMTRETLELLADPERAGERSRLARSRCDELYDLHHTYDRMLDELCEWIGVNTHEAGRILT